MALPKLDAPTYTLEVPSTGEKIKFRPFLVKEQKVLMLAEESKDDNQIYNAMETLITSCTFGKVDVKTVNLFDVEYIFLQLRAKSVGEKVELNLLCPDDNETRVPTEVDLTELDIDVGEGHTDKIPLTNNITMHMRYPTLDNIRTIEKKSGEVDSVFSILNLSIIGFLAESSMTNSFSSFTSTPSITPYGCCAKGPNLSVIYFSCSSIHLL